MVTLSGIEIKFIKAIGTLPNSLERNSIYFIKQAGDKFELFLTSNDEIPIAHALYTNNIPDSTIMELVGYNVDEVKTERRYINNKPIYRRVFSLDKSIIPEWIVDGDIHMFDIPQMDLPVGNFIFQPDTVDPSNQSGTWYDMNLLNSNNTDILCALCHNGSVYLRIRGYYQKFTKLTYCFEYTKSTDDGNTPVTMLSSTPDLYIQDTEPSVVPGKTVLWIDTSDSNFIFKMVKG